MFCLYILVLRIHQNPNVETDRIKGPEDKFVYFIILKANLISITKSDRDSVDRVGDLGNGVNPQKHEFDNVVYYAKYIIQRQTHV